MKLTQTLVSNTLTRIEPLSWWVGMKTPLQLMLQGKNIAGSTVLILDAPGIAIKKIHKADSENYLFVDIEISQDASPGTYTFELKKEIHIITFDYTFDKRRRGSANRKSFSSADMVYLLFPDRFANGNPDNDSTPDTIEKADRNNYSGRHGGDLQGIINHLDYFAGLGATTLWMTPPQLDNEKDNSYHGYACADYYHIDPRIGDNDLYRQLVKQAHNIGLKIIMDAVPNHCGTAHWWMKDLPFKDWVHQHKGFQRSNYRLATITDPNSSRLNEDHTVDGWFDYTMPDMSMENPYVLQYFIQLYIWWVEWADLDGLRVDTFPYNDKYAISEWTQQILVEYPNLNIVAECWHSSPAIVAYWLGSTHNVDGYTSHLPSVMDFPLQEALQDSLSVDSTEWAQGMNRLYEAMAQDFLYTDPRQLLIFLDNHDTGRFADSVRGNVDRIKLGITLLATLRGIPQLYYGTEQGLRSSDTSKGDGAARCDFPGGWSGDRKNYFTGKALSKKEADIYKYTSRLFNWRKTAEAIHKGKTMHYLPKDNTYSFFRYTENKCVFVFINASNKDITVPWKWYEERIKGYTEGINIITGRKIKISGSFAVKGRTAIVVDMEK